LKKNTVEKRITSFRKNVLKKLKYGKYEIAEFFFNHLTIKPAPTCHIFANKSIETASKY